MEVGKLYRSVISVSYSFMKPEEHPMSGVAQGYLHVNDTVILVRFYIPNELSQTSGHKWPTLNGHADYNAYYKPLNQIAIKTIWACEFLWNGHLAGWKVIYVLGYESELPNMFKAIKI